jgi:hypothetical protein
MATYTDAVGTEMEMRYSPATMMVGAETITTTGSVLGDRFDAEANGGDGDGVIDQAEVYNAVFEYLFGDTTDIGLEDLRAYVTAFLFPGS